jgi:hypothetical protein
VRIRLKLAADNRRDIGYFLPLDVLNQRRKACAQASVTNWRKKPGAKD